MSSEFSSYTKKELLQKLKKQKLGALIHGFIVFLMILISVSSILDEEITFQTALPLFFIPMQVFLMLEIKKINKELAKRNKSE